MKPKKKETNSGLNLTSLDTTDSEEDRIIVQNHVNLISKIAEKIKLARESGRGRFFSPFRLQGTLRKASLNGKFHANLPKIKMSCI